MNDNPAENTVTKPVDNVVAKPTENTATKPVDNVVAKPTENTATKPVDKAQNKDLKTVKPARKPAKKAPKKAIDASKEKKETNSPEKVASGSANNSDEIAS